MSEKLRFGVAGAGVFGAYHARKIAAHNHAELVGVFDIREERATDLSLKFAARRFHSFCELANEVDAVVIATPASCHFELAREALALGVHALVEKPLALNLIDADKLIDLADAKNLVLQVGHQERYVFAAAGLLDGKSIPVKIDCVRFAAASGRCDDVSVVFDLMVHDLDLVRQLTRSEMNKVRATGDTDEASAELELANGCTASLKASRRASSLERRMTLYYEEGVVEFDFVKREMANSTPMHLQAAFSDTDISLAFADPLAFGTDRFIHAIQTGTQPIVNGLDGRAAVDWALKIEDAASISVEDQVDTIQRLTA